MIKVFIFLFKYQILKDPSNLAYHVKEFFNFSKKNQRRILDRYFDYLDDDEDEIIKMLDEAVYSNIYGISTPLKKSEFQYEFHHPSYPNMCVIISRYKVLRLCKLLRDNDCWINKESSFIDRENALLSIVLKDTILCDYEMSMVRFVIREVLKNGLIKVPSDNDDKQEKRGAR